jgi:hypothetical protein
MTHQTADIAKVMTKRLLKHHQNFCAGDREIDHPTSHESLGQEN